nr:MAG TPA: hypothetical protein [Caudoviricetes sp.]
MAILKETIINGDTLIKGILSLQNKAGLTMCSDVASAIQVLRSEMDNLYAWYRSECPNVGGWVMRIGPIVRYSYHNIWTPPAGLYNHFTTIPAGFRPTDTIRQSFNTIANEKINNYITVGVEANGNVATWSLANTITEYYFDMIWITRDGVPDDSLKIQ